MKSIDIKPHDLDTVKKILYRHIPGIMVLAFGSRVTGKAGRFSDLDLVVMEENPLSLSILSALADDFTESDVPFKVDIIDWATTNDSFREIIRKKYVVIQCEESRE